MVKTREEKKQHDWFLEAKVVMCVGGGKESRHWGRKKEIKTIWDDVSSRNKTKKQQQEWRVQIPLGGGKSENSCVLWTERDCLRNHW